MKARITLPGARYQAGFDVNNAVEPALRQLSIATGESASFYAREGDSRACISRVEGPQAVRHHVRIGERLPLDKGAPGKGRIRTHPPVRLPHLHRRARAGSGQRGGAGVRPELAATGLDVHLGPDIQAVAEEAGGAREDGDRRGECAVV